MGLTQGLEQFMFPPEQQQQQQQNVISNRAQIESLEGYYVSGG